MNKSILISIRPEHVVKILNGNKSLELRKNIPADFEEIVKKYGGIWVNIYVTNALPFLIDYHGEYILSPKHLWGLKELNGKVVARFWLDEYEAFDSNLGHPRIYTKACVDDKEMPVYFNGKLGYAWHIKKLEIFDKPKELSEFYTYRNPYLPHSNTFEVAIIKAPQSWQYVWEEVR